MDTELNLNIKVVIKLGFQLSVMYYSNLITAKVFKETNILSAKQKPLSDALQSTVLFPLFILHSLQYSFRNGKISLIGFLKSNADNSLVGH